MQFFSNEVEESPMTKKRPVLLNTNLLGHVTSVSSDKVARTWDIQCFATKSKTETETITTTN